MAMGTELLAYPDDPMAHAISIGRADRPRGRRAAGVSAVRVPDPVPGGLGRAPAPVAGGAATGRRSLTRSRDGTAYPSSGEGPYRPARLPLLVRPDRSSRVPELWMPETRRTSC